MTPTTRPALTDITCTDCGAVVQSIGWTEHARTHNPTAYTDHWQPRPALTEPATEAGRALRGTLTQWSDNGPGDEPAHKRRMRSITKAILAIEAEAVQREREALVELVADALESGKWIGGIAGRYGKINRVYYDIEARRLLGLDERPAGGSAPPIP